MSINTENLNDYTEFDGTVVATVNVEDSDQYEGVCQHCGREDLKWIVVLSDGSQIGRWCAGSVIAPRPLKKDRLAKQSTSTETLITQYEQANTSKRRSQKRVDFIVDLLSARADNDDEVAIAWLNDAPRD